MKKLLLLLILAPSVCSAQLDSLEVMFWNLENFFDYHSGNGPAGWTAGRFYRKCDAIAKTVFKIADSFGRLPDAIGFAEVENSYVLKELRLETTLRKLDYGVIHFDSPDHRGIDCALLYRKSSLRLISAEPEHLYDKSGNIMPTRDILLSQFKCPDGDTLAVLVNHHPSQIGGKTEGRLIAMERLEALMDSLKTAGCYRLIAVGDFNEDRWRSSRPGTIKYNGAWEKIDGCFSSGFSNVSEQIFDDESLTEKDRTYGGRKPRRCFVGPRYNGGISDHYPIVVTVFY